ncbi:unnamed protein product [Callosobruchus maculatus]|uniref:Odorant receptor n=1 Tax=Callosobruchus maculatus TaxID=64391 RepID=A0A653DUA4_CALMS|nr:unnamed protein product [Callosobruchus maculatus]
MSFDTLFMTTLNLTRIQFHIVNAQLKKLFTSKNEQNYIYDKKRMNLLAEHHGFLLRYINDINHTFSTPLLGYMALLIFSLCLEMYNVSTSGSVEVLMGAASYVLVAIWGLVALFALPAEMMLDEVYKICDSIYSSAWYNHPKEKQTILLIIANAQKKMYVQAGKFVNVNLATSLNGIQRSSGLYFNKSTLAILIRRMETDFWSPDDVPLSKEEKQFFADTHQRLKTAFKMLILFCSLNSGCACFQTFFLPKNAFVMVFSIVVPIVSLDVMLMTILVLTELQFKLLNKEVEAVFDIDAATDENVDKRINRIQNSAYFSRWYNYPKQAQSMMLMISAAQRDVTITAGGLININLETSLSTIKTMVSYCMFLQTMGNK